VTLVIVGTGTGVGKTLVAATVLARFGAEMPLAYWKPVATGSIEDRDTETVAALAGERAVILAESYLFPEPVSPHLAARLAGSRIDPAKVLADFDRHCAAHDALVIEAAGGLLVPLTGGEGDEDGPAGHDGEAPDRYDPGYRPDPGHRSDPVRRSDPGPGRSAGAGGGAASLGAEAAGGGRGWPFRSGPAALGLAAPDPPAARRAAAAPAAAAPAATVPAAAGGYLQSDLLVDMAHRSALSCLLVAHSGLGTINHTLLTLEALRTRGLAVAGVVLDGPPNRENRLAIQRLGRVEAVFELPHVAPIDRQEVAGLARFFDREGRLAPLLWVGGPPSRTRGGAAETPRRAAPS